MRFLDVMRWHVQPRILPLLIRPEKIATRQVADMLLPANVTSDWICYCIGVGEDIRFEKHLTEEIGAEVWAFDPTPRSIAYMRNTPQNGRLHFIPKGIWKENAILRFYAPPNPTWVSHSITEKTDYGHFDASCMSVSSAMRSLGHERIDLLKMNIEGAEHEVLSSMLRDGIRPKAIILTWEGKGAMRKAWSWTRRLRREGYVFAGRLIWFFTYVTPLAPLAPSMYQEHRP